MSAHVCVSKMQERVNTAKSLNGSWEFVFLRDLHWEETPTLFVLVRSWISLLKRQWNFSRRQSAAGATMAGAAVSGETQKPAQAGLGARVSGGHGLCQVAIEGLQSGAVTRTEEAFSRQSGSGSECGANSIHPLHLSPLPPPRTDVNARPLRAPGPSSGQQKYAAHSSDGFHVVAPNEPRHSCSQKVL